MKRRWKIAAAVAVCAAMFTGGVLTSSPVKGVAKLALRKAGLTPTMKQTLQRAGLLAAVRKLGLVAEPVPEALLLAPDRVSARRHIVASLHGALRRGDLREASFLNSVLAQEALQRAHRVLKAWERIRDPETGLVPFTTNVADTYWNAKDVGADLFGFLLMASRCLDPDSGVAWVEALATERALSGSMPRTIRFRPARTVAEDLPSLIFGASEYAKDGLLAVAERCGRGPWFARLEEVMETLIDNAYVDTGSGYICSSTAEKNGEMLQVLSRLYWATGKHEYLQMAERIAEAYLFEVLPNNHDLPAHDWDFVKGEPVSPFFRLRDHGNEIIPGLAELYFLERMQSLPQAARYRQPLKRFLDLILAVGRTEDGLWHNSVDVRTRQTRDAGVVDCWGYILNAYQTLDLAEGTSVYAQEIERTMRSAAARKSFPWEGSAQDGYADAIESMLYLLPWFDIPECHHWVDDEIEVMFGMQTPSGFVDAGHLDGNFIRTSLLYAAYKTQGVLAYPWRDDVCVGAAYDKGAKELYVYICSGEQWEGVLKFDPPRHHLIWHLPSEYPRLNGTPEWFTVEPEKDYSVVDLESGEDFHHSGQRLAQGLPISLREQPFRRWLKVSKE